MATISPCIFQQFLHNFSTGLSTFGITTLFPSAYAKQRRRYWLSLSLIYKSYNKVLMMGSGNLQSHDRKNEQAEKKQSPKSNRLVKYKNTKEHRTHGTDARPYRVCRTCWNGVRTTHRLV